MVQNLLDVVQSKTTENSKTTVQPEALSESESSDSGGGNDEGSETRRSDDSGTSQERTTNVEVLLLLSSSANNGETTHHGNGVETSTAQKRGRNEGEQRGDEGSLGGVEGGPESVLGDIAENTLVNSFNFVIDYFLRILTCQG